MRPTVILDATPLGLLTQRRGVAQADDCRRWLASLRAAGYRVAVPEISDYEVRRELLRARKAAGVERLDAFLAARPRDYLPLSTAAMRAAAQLWAEARQHGWPTSANDALDGDVILAAQAMTPWDGPDSILIATANVGHLSRFAPAELWESIQPGTSA